MTKKKTQNDATKATFEEAYGRLTEIAAELEGGEISLDESIGRYEEGMKLIARCQKILAEAEAKIELLATKADGSLAGKSFDGAEATGLPDAPPSIRIRHTGAQEDGLF